MRKAGMKPGRETALSDEDKKRIVKRAIGILKSGYDKKTAERMTGHNMESAELWAEQFGIAWPEKHKRKKREVKV